LGDSPHKFCLWNRNPNFRLRLKLHHLKIVGSYTGSSRPKIAWAPAPQPWLQLTCPRNFYVRGLERLDGARGEKQVWRPRVRTWGLSETNLATKKVLVTLLGLFGAPRISDSTLGVLRPPSPSLAPPRHPSLHLCSTCSLQFINLGPVPSARFHAAVEIVRSHVFILTQDILMGSWAYDPSQRLDFSDNGIMGLLKRLQNQILRSLSSHPRRAGANRQAHDRHFDGTALKHTQFSTLNDLPEWPWWRLGFARPLTYARGFLCIERSLVSYCVPARPPLAERCLDVNSFWSLALQMHFLAVFPILFQT